MNEYDYWIEGSPTIPVGSIMGLGVNGGTNVLPEMPEV